MARSLVCLRYFLVGNVIILGISGIVAAVFAGLFIYQLQEYAPLTPDNVCGSSITLLVMGVITCIFSWCSWQFMDFTNKSQVISLAALLATLSAIEAGAGIWALVRHEQIDTSSIARLERTNVLSDENDKHVWDRIQSKVRCCGVDGPSDYHAQELIPWSCCDTSSLLNSSDTKALCTTIYARGCIHPVTNRTRSILLYVFLVTLCLVLFQIYLIMCIYCYARSFSKRIRRRRRQSSVKNESELLS